MNSFALRFGRRLGFLVLLSCALAVAAAAQETATPVDPPQSPPQEAGTTIPPKPAPERTPTGFVELGGSYEGLSSDYGHWSGGYLRSVLTTGRDTWNGEVNGQNEFGDDGVYLALGDTHTFSPDWYGAVTIGSSVGGFFWPRFRVDAFLNRKWAQRKQFVTTLGAGYDMAKDVHRDHRAFIGTIYYFEAPWIVEDGVYFNLSNPGNAFSASGFVAVTQGRNEHHYLTLKVGFGQEAYQLIGPNTVLTRFPSQTAVLTWRKWVGKKWGFNLITDFYHSPFYDRGGGSLGFFREF
jgi:YaiO family outer membrane protein